MKPTRVCFLSNSIYQLDRIRVAPLTLTLIHLERLVYGRRGLSIFSFLPPFFLFKRGCGSRVKSAITNATGGIIYGDDEAARNCAQGRPQVNRRFVRIARGIGEERPLVVKASSWHNDAHQSASFAMFK